jgi:hypothetical protein
MSDPFWSTNIEVLFDKDKLKYFFPDYSYPVVENLNAIVRLMVYISIVLVLYTRDTRYFILPVCTLLITYIIYVLYPNQDELFQSPIPPCNRTIQDMVNNKNKKKKCVKPTTDNPFMNFNYITDDYHRPPACEAFLYEDKKSTKLKEKITDKFNEKLYRDVGDIYSKRNGQREFYTVAYNGIPDQTSFAKWLYGQSATCKENGLKCAPYTGSLM